MEILARPCYRNSMTAKNRSLSPFWWWLAVLPFFLNDFSGIYLETAATWMAADYGSRILPLLLVWWLVVSGRTNWRALGVRWPGWLPMLVWAVALSAVGTAIDQWALPLFDQWLPFGPWSGYPIESGTWLSRIDLSFGLALVAVSEEAVFRSLAQAALARVQPLTLYLLTAIVFGAVHWSVGPGTCLNAALIGVVFLYGLRVCGSIWPAVVAHFVVNFIAYGL